MLSAEGCFCKAEMEDKLSFLFDIFDADNSDSMDIAEVTQLLYTVVDGIAILLEQPPVPIGMLNTVVERAFRFSKRQIHEHLHRRDVVNFFKAEYPDVHMFFKVRKDLPSQIYSHIHCSIADRVLCLSRTPENN